MFGSMAKSFQPGRAAQNGYTAALLGRAGFHGGRTRSRGSARLRGRHRGRIRPRQGHDEARGRLRAARQRLQALRVRPRRASRDRRLQPAAPRAPSGGQSISPPCGSASRRSCSISATRRISRRALESKYSIYHAAAIGLVRGKGGLQEFTDEAVRDPKLAHVRGVTTAVADSSIGEDQVHIEVALRDGRKLVKFVEQSLGNVHRPLSDARAHGEVRRPGGARIAARASRCRSRAMLAHRRARRRRRPRARHHADRRTHVAAERAPLSLAAATNGLDRRRA